MGDGALGRVPHGAVPHVAREHIWPQRFERQVRVFHRPGGVARVDADAHVVGSCRFHQHFQLARLHVARVILDRELHAGIDDARPHVPQHFQRFVDVPLDAARRLSIERVADDAPDERGAARDGGVDDARQLLLGCPLRGIEDPGRGTHGQHADL